LSTTVPEVGQESAARTAGSLRLWIILSAGLALAFLADGPVMNALKPFHDSGSSGFIRHTIRWLGIGYVQAFLLIVLVIVGGSRLPRVRSAGGWGLLALGISGVMANILKVLVHRARPYVELPHPDSWMSYVRDHRFQSFPSGESTTAFAVAVALGLWFPRARAPLIMVAAVVALARVVVGDHAPSDVWAGAMLGTAVAQWVGSRAASREQQGSEGAA